MQRPRGGNSWAVCLAQPRQLTGARVARLGEKELEWRCWGGGAGKEARCALGRSRLTIPLSRHPQHHQAYHGLTGFPNLLTIGVSCKRPGLTPRPCSWCCLTLYRLWRVDSIQDRRLDSVVTSAVVPDANAMVRGHIIFRRAFDWTLFQHGYPPVQKDNPCITMVA